MSCVSAFGKTPVGRIVGSAMVGGTISKLTGGKFANGALTSAFAALLRADWGDKSNKSVANNKFNQNDKAAFDKDLETLNHKVTRQQGFGSSDEAAEWLHDNAHDLSVKYNAEVGAKIYEQSDGTFAVGKVVTNYHSERVSLGPSSWIGNVHSTWHSHGTSFVSKGYIYSFTNFSPQDVKTTNFYNFGYMSTTDIRPTKDYLFRIPGGGTNADKCIVGSTC